MNTMKAEVKVLTIQEMGSQMDDALEAAEKEVYRAEGGMEWLKKAAAAHKAVAERVSSDMDEGKIDPEWGVLQIAEYTKKSLDLLLQGLNDLALQAQTQKLAATGRVAGVKHCVNLAKKSFDTEKLKLEAELARLQKAKREAEERGEDPEGVQSRPRTNGAAQDLAARKAAAKAAKAKASKARAAAKKKTAKKATKKAKRGASNTR